MYRKIIERLCRQKKSGSPVLPPHCRVGSGTVLQQSFAIRSVHGNKVSIGNDSMIGCRVVFESDRGEVEIGDRTFINNDTNIIARTKVRIGNDVMIAWGCTIYDHDAHALDWQDRVRDIRLVRENYQKGIDLELGKNWDHVRSKPICIQDKVWIGFGSVILKGVTVGEGAVVGAQSVVRKDVPPWSVVIGNPAVVVRTLKKE